MKIPVNILEELIRKENLSELEFEIDVMSSPERVSDVKPILLTDRYINLLKSQNIDIVYLRYDALLERFLKRHFKDRFGISEKEQLFLLKRYLIQYKLANELSAEGKTVFKRRDIILLQEVLDTSGDKTRVIAHYNSILDEKTLSQLIAKYTDNFRIKFTHNERGLMYVHDPESANVELVRIQFVIRKIFHDIGYKNIIITDSSNKGLLEYFRPSRWYYPKLVILGGKTTNNILFYKKLILFDPFAKVEWFSATDLELSKDEIFDKVTERLAEDYTKEFSDYSLTREEKSQAQMAEIQQYREAIGKLGRNFNLKDYIDIAYELQEKNKLIDMFTPITHLENVLKDLKLTRSRIFQMLLKNHAEIN